MTGEAASSAESDPTAAGPTDSDSTDPADSDSIDTDPADPTDPGDSPSGVKAAPDGTPIERAIPAEQWEAVGRRAIATLVEDRRNAVDEAVGELVSAIRFGAPVDETHLRNLRDAIAGLESVTEHDLTDLMEDAIPFERTVGRVPYGRMVDALGVEMDDLNRARALAEHDEDRVEDGPAGDSEA